MNYILFDGDTRQALLPFTYTIPVADIRVGILTIREKWEKYLGSTTTTVTEEYLSQKYPMVELENNIFINGSFLPTPALVDAISFLEENQAIYYQDTLVAFYAKQDQEVDLDSYTVITFDKELLQITHPTLIFSENEKAIQQDFELLTTDRKSQELSTTNTVLGDKQHIFIEPGASIEFACLNTTKGPIYIGKDAQIMEGSFIRGPFALCDNATVKMGAKIYGATTVGPHCKVAGEISNAVLFGYSNKGHEGFLGNSVIGHWCNLGADTNTSNLKNDYSKVRLWDYQTQRFARTDMQFCGLLMGDHSKSSINTMFNTGTVVGVNANIFGSGFPKNFVPSFTWGNSATPYLTKKACAVAQVVMDRRDVAFTAIDEAIFEAIFEQTQIWRK